MLCLFPALALASTAVPGLGVTRDLPAGAHPRVDGQTATVKTGGLEIRITREEGTFDKVEMDDRRCVVIRILTLKKRFGNDRLA